MSVKYLDPWKDDPYGKLRGEKQDTYFQVNFDEAKIYPLENGYALAAYVNSYSGVVRNFKPDQPLESGLCVVPIYDAEYEIRQKIDGKWEGVKYQPSKFEKAICEHIHGNETLFLNDNHAIQGSIAFVPDGMVASLDDKMLAISVQQQVQVNPTALTGKLPSYTPPTAYQRQNKSWGGSKSESTEEKLALIKKELTQFSSNDDASESDTLGMLVTHVWSEHADCPDFLNHYFNILTAIAR